jgi:hypothetical protein
MSDREKQINLALQTVAWSRMVLRVAGPNVSKSAFAGQGVMQAEDFASVFEHHDTVIAALLLSMLRASRLPLCVDIAARTDLRLGRFVPANHKEIAVSSMRSRSAPAPASSTCVGPSTWARLPTALATRTDERRHASLLPTFPLSSSPYPT